MMIPQYIICVEQISFAYIELLQCKDLPIQNKLPESFFIYSLLATAIQQEGEITKAINCLNINLKIRYTVFFWGYPQAVKGDPDLEITLRLFLKLSEAVRFYTSKFFNQSSFYTKETKLVCRKPAEQTGNYNVVIYLTGVPSLQLSQSNCQFQDHAQNLVLCGLFGTYLKRFIYCHITFNLIILILL